MSTFSNITKRTFCGLGLMCVASSLTSCGLATSCLFNERPTATPGTLPIAILNEEYSVELATFIENNLDVTYVDGYDFSTSLIGELPEGLVYQRTSENTARITGTPVESGIFPLTWRIEASIENDPFSDDDDDYFLCDDDRDQRYDLEVKITASD